MATVYNPQLGRQMEYPYEGPRTKRKFQWAAVINTNRCLECQTCTAICKQTWTSGRGQERMFFSNVETKPYGGFPFMWAQKTLSILPEGKTIFEAPPAGKKVLGYTPEARDWDFANFAEDQPFGDHEVGKGKVVENDPSTGKYGDMWMHYLTRMCNHCEFPSCVAACPRQAIYKREEDGLVLIDQEQCRGFRECIAACPYKKSFFNQVTRTSQKCVGCYPRVEAGLQPLCFAACPGKTRIVGNIEDESPDNPIWYLIKGPNRMALPLYPQFGTGPQVYYIPPWNVPPEPLAEMFTHNHDVKLIQSIQRRYKQLYKEPKSLAALMLCGATERIVARYRIEGNDVIALDGSGTEVVRVPIEERVVVNEGAFLNDL